MSERDFNAELSMASQALKECHTRYKLASEETSRVRSEECSALNAVNAAQKQFDAIVAEMKKQAPRDSDWKRGQ